MRAHAKLRVEREMTEDGNSRIRMPRLRSEGALVLRPTRELLPEWADRWEIDRREVATVRLAAGAAGPLGGDHWRLEVEVAEGATLLLSAVAAVVSLPGAHGEQSWSEAHLSVARGATLIWLPGAQIAATGCSQVAFNQIDLQLGARLYAREEIVLGRHGEQPGNFSQRLRVTQDGKALYDQELAVGPESLGWNSAAVTGGRRALGSIIIVDTVAGNLDCLSESVSSAYPDTAIMRLAENAALISSLAADTIELRARLDAAFSPFGRTAKVSEG